jgi:DNA-binding NtrC family response regulator
MNPSSTSEYVSTRIVGDSAQMRRLRELIRRIANSELPVLIQGPTGSGKELVAEALHASSDRPGRFVPFNVCAISDSMFEDALFGHVKGAFTGAGYDRPGYLLEADRGTLFLDEISGLGHGAQAKLLRAIETRTFRPVGGRADRTSEFRVLSATNEGIEELVRAGTFRRDLAHRLQGFVLTLPPLRDRLEDLPLLAHHFLPLDGPPGSSITGLGLSELARHDWPGNVRELRHVLARAAVFAEGEPIERMAVREAIQNAREPLPPPTTGHDELARRRLVAVLDEARWDTAVVAATLGVHRATVYRHMSSLGIKRPQPRPDNDRNSRPGEGDRPDSATG